jgi:hypothetical protein
MLGKHYFRCDPELPDDIPIRLDAVMAREELVAFAHTVDITDMLQWVQEHVYAPSDGAATAS